MATLPDFLKREEQKILAAGLEKWIPIDKKKWPDYQKAAKKADIILKGIEDKNSVWLFCKKDQNMDRLWDFLGE